MKKGKNIELGPLCLSKTQYKPYLGEIKTRLNSKMSMDGTNIMIDMPPAQQTIQPLVESSSVKLRNKITKILQLNNENMKEVWKHYVNKAIIFTATCSEWIELETFLLKIIANLLTSEAKMKDKIQDLSQFQEQRLSQFQSFNNKIDLLSTKKYKKNKINCLSSIQKNFDLTYNNIQKGKKFGSINKTQYGNNKFLGHITDNQIIFNQTMFTNKQNSVPNLIHDTNVYKQGNNLQIILLEKQIQILQEKMRIKEEQYEKKLKQSCENIVEDLKAKYNEALEQKMKFENEVEGKKFHNNILSKQFSILKEKYLNLEKQYQQALENNKITKMEKESFREYQRYRELWLMQYEEILQLNSIICAVKKERDNEIKKNLGLKQKLKELSKNFNYNYNISLENEKDKQDLNKVLKDFRDWLKFIAVPRVSKGMLNNNTFFPQMTLENNDEKLLASYLPKDDETNYKLLRPNFFIYFQAYQGIIVAQRKFPQRKTMSPDFFLTIRAILDSMFLHFTFSADFWQWKNFPEFAISFIEKYEIHPQQRIIVLKKNQCQGQEKINFLLNVFNLDAANTWQCDIFRSFLLEEFTLDEIYFYLDCRNSLLKGTQLNNNFGSSDTINYITIQNAQKILTNKLENYDSEMMSRIRKFIKSKRKKKNNKQFVDINFVLKLLLEVYSIQKIKSQKFFHNSFKSKQKQAKITYTEYSAFMLKNFQFLTMSDIAKLYREIYTVGVGKITYKTIHFICSTRGLFIPLLQAKLLKNKLIKKQQKIFDDSLFLNFQNESNKIASVIANFGVEQIQGLDLAVNQLLNDSSLLRQNKELFQIRFLKLTQKIVKIKSITSWRGKKLNKGNEMNQDEFRQKVSQLLAFTYQCSQDIQIIKKNKQQRQNAFQKLTRNFKIRIQESFLQFKVSNENNLQNKLLSLQKSKDQQGDHEESDQDQS